MRRRFLIVSDALVESFRDLLAVSRALQTALVGGAADKGNFGKNGGHGRASQDDESGILDAAIANVRVIRGQGGIERMLDAGR